MWRGGRKRSGIGLGVGLVLLALAGCGRPAGSATTSVGLLRLDQPMDHAVWSSSARALVGVTPSGRLEKLVPATRASTVSPAPLPDAGDDLAPGLPDDPVIYVPQPRLDRVAVVRVADLRTAATLSAGARPSYVSTDVGANALLALSKSGAAVTAVSIHHGDVLSTQSLAAPADAVDGSGRERVIDFHVTGPHGIQHFEQGDDSASLDIPVSADATDPTKTTRVYVAQTGTDDLVAVDSRRGGEGLEVVGRADLGAPVLFVGADATRIYAVTADRLVVLETRSYGGFPGDRIPVLRTIDIRSALPPGLRGAPISGLAVGTDRVYLTVAHAPYVLSVTKPSV